MTQQEKEPKQKKSGLFFNNTRKMLKKSFDYQKEKTVFNKLKESFLHLTDSAFGKNKNEDRPISFDEFRENFKDSFTLADYKKAYRQNLFLFYFMDVMGTMALIIGFLYVQEESNWFFKIFIALAHIMGSFFCYVLALRGAVLCYTLKHGRLITLKDFFKLKFKDQIPSLSTDDAWFSKKPDHKS